MFGILEVQAALSYAQSVSQRIGMSQEKGRIK